MREEFFDMIYKINMMGKGGERFWERGTEKRSIGGKDEVFSPQGALLGIGGAFVVVCCVR